MTCRLRRSAGTRLVAASAMAALVVACGSAAGPAAAPSPPTLAEPLPGSSNGVVLPSPPPPDTVAAPDAVAAPDEDAAPDGASSLPADEAPRGPGAGYTGDRWASELDGQVRVLDDTLTLRDGVLRGLVRNEGPGPVGPVGVRAGSSTAVVPLPVLRPGEPAPFTLPVEATAPGDVDVVVDAPPAVSSTGRDLVLATFWTRAPDDPREVDTYLFTDPEAGPRPAVAFGEVRAAEDVERLVVVAAWVDDEGRVLAVDESADLARTDLAPGGASDFVVAAPGPDELGAARLVLWGSGS